MKVERNNFEYSQTGNKDVKSPEKETLNSVFGDKNGNNIVDEDDFTQEQLSKIGDIRDLVWIFNQKWTKPIQDLFSKIFNSSENNTDNNEIVTLCNQQS